MDALRGRTGTPIANAAGTWTDFAALLPADGSYLLAVEGQTDVSGSVSYNFAVVGPPVTGLTLGQPVSGKIANSGDIATYSVHGQATGQSLLLIVLRRPRTRRGTGRSQR